MAWEHLSGKGFSQMVSWQKEPLRLRFAAALLRFLRKFSAILPLRFLPAFGAATGRLILPFFPQERRVMKAQLRVAAAHAGDARTRSWAESREANRIMRNCLGHAGESLAESFVLERLLENGCVQHGPPVQEASFHESWGPGKGVLALSAHFGCFELLAASHARRKVPVTVVGRTPNYGGMAELLGELRQSYGVETIWRDESGGARRLISTLKQPRVLAVLLDQDTDLESLHPTFFGLPAASPVAPVRLAVRGGNPIFTTFIVRRSRLRHEVITEALPYNPQDPEAEQKILQEFSRRLQHLIIEFPSQWLWWHRRWRREPEIDYRAHPELLRGTAAYLQWLEQRTS